MTYVITEACMDVMDKSCIQECPVDCIKVGKNMLYIDPNDCVDCGACVPVCPTEAIYYEDDLPKHLEHYKDINKNFFA
jgi:NAD-dependent dihydropyrimidine dehydrogenase PreA subunit